MKGYGNKFTEIGFIIKCLNVKHVLLNKIMNGISLLMGDKLYINFRNFGN